MLHERSDNVMIRNKKNYNSIAPKVQQLGWFVMIKWWNKIWDYFSKNKIVLFLAQNFFLAPESFFLWKIKTFLVKKLKKKLAQKFKNIKAKIRNINAKIQIFLARKNKIFCALFCFVTILSSNLVDHEFVGNGVSFVRWWH